MGRLESEQTEEIQLTVEGVTVREGLRFYGREKRCGRVGQQRSGQPHAGDASEVRLEVCCCAIGSGSNKDKAVVGCRY